MGDKGQDGGKNLGETPQGSTTSNTHCRKLKQGKKGNGTTSDLPHQNPKTEKAPQRIGALVATGKTSAPDRRERQTGKTDGPTHLKPDRPSGRGSHGGPYDRSRSSTSIMTSKWKNGGETRGVEGLGGAKRPIGDTQKTHGLENPPPETRELVKGSM